MEQHALNLARLGCRVFPCVPGKKLPSIAEWPTRATTDEAQIREWWSGDCVVTTKNGKQLKLSANCNIGFVPGDDNLIIDVDCKNGDLSGKRSLDTLVSRGLPPTFTVQTPSGGLQLYYRKPDKRYIKSIADWMPGIDIRGTRGQGVGPGSIVDGVSYTVVKNLPIVALSMEFYIEMPFKVATAQSPPLSGGPLQIDAFIDEESQSSQYSDLPDKVASGGRDDTVFRYACSWRHRGYSIEVGRVLMEKLHSLCEQPPGDEFTLEEALDKLDRAYSTYDASPRAVTDWTSFVTPDQRIVEAPTEQVRDLEYLLTNNIFIESDSMVVDSSKHPSRCTLSLGDFKNSNLNLFYLTEEGPRGGAPKKVSLVSEWMSHDERQTCYDTGYHPSGVKVYTEFSQTYYNTYFGSGNEIVEKYDLEKIQPILDHLHYMFPERVTFNFFLNWMAFTVQKPDIRIPWAPLLISEEGVGKGFIFELMEKVLGPQNVKTALAKELSANSQFNDFLYRTTLVLIDDLRATNEEVINTLKPMITANHLTINLKYGAKDKCAIFCNFIIFSNYVDAMKLSEGDRRYWVYHILAHPQTSVYYKGLWAWKDKTDGPAQFEAYLRSIDISNWDHAARPATTAAKKRMIAVSRSPIETAILDAVEDRWSVFKYDIVSTNIVCDFILNALDLPTAKGLSNRQRDEIGKILKNLSPKSLPYRRIYTGLSPNRMQIRPHIVRDADKWISATQEEVAEEFLRAKNSISIIRGLGE